MELRHLRYFLAVAEERNFSHAAELLHIAQPPLSKQIHDLEDELGTKLFTRRAGKVDLTPAGIAFRKHVETILDDVSQAVHAAQRAGHGDAGELAVGFFGAFIANCNVLTAAIERYRTKYPAVVVTLHEIMPGEQIEAVHQGTVDVCIGRRPSVIDDSVCMEVIFEERIGVFLPASHRLATSGAIAIVDLANEGFIMLPSRLSGSFNDRVAMLCARAGFTPRLAQETTQLLTIGSFVAAGVGIALVPESMRANAPAGVVYRDFPAREAATSEVVMLWRRDQTESVVRAFIDGVRSARSDDAPLVAQNR